MNVPEKKQLVIIAAVLLVIVGFGAGRFYPLSRASAKIKSVRALQDAEAWQVEQYAGMIPDLRDRVAGLADATDRFDERIPGSRQFADLWEQIADVMNTHDLRDQIVQPGTEIAGEQVNCIPLTIQCSGSMSRIFDMLNSLDDFERSIRIESLDMVNDAKYSGSLKLTAKANVYYRISTDKSK